MNYRDLKWSELRAFASSQGINIKGLNKVDIYKALDLFNNEPETIHLPCDTKLKLEPFKGIKVTHPLFKAIEYYLPYLRAYNKVINGKKLEATSNVEGVNEGIAKLFMKYIEVDKRANINLGGCCIHKYYPRLINGYNKLAKEHGRECI